MSWTSRVRLEVFADDELPLDRRLCLYSVKIAKTENQFRLFRIAEGKLKSQKIAHLWSSMKNSFPNFSHSRAVIASQLEAMEELMQMPLAVNSVADIVAAVGSRNIKATKEQKNSSSSSFTSSKQKQKPSTKTKTTEEAIEAQRTRRYRTNT